jgi:hypothetical protein
MNPGRRLGLLFALAACALLAVAPAITQGGAAPADYCGAAGKAAASAAGDGDPGAPASPAGSCPCCRLHAAQCIAQPPPLPFLLHRHAVAEKPRAARDHALFDVLLAWRELHTQGPPCVR